MMENHRALEIGRRIENLRIESVLGEGGFGITYLAVDLQLRRHVALKELLPVQIALRFEALSVAPITAGLNGEWEWALRKFEDEARTLASFSHPAIVGVHRLLEANGTLYMVMDYVSGESYERVLRRIGRESDEVALMKRMAPLLEGLEVVHESRYTHRDIKPENIIIRENGAPVLIDFGTARQSVGGGATITTILGTPKYAPFEQFQSNGRIGPWTDMYALGVVMCRAITGDMPPLATERAMQDPFHWLSNRKLPGYSRDFLLAVDWALRVRPGDRPQNIATWRRSFRLRT